MRFCLVYNRVKYSYTPVSTFDQKKSHRISSHLADKYYPLMEIHINTVKKKIYDTRCMKGMKSKNIVTQWAILRPPRAITLSEVNDSKRKTTNVFIQTQVHCKFYTLMGLK
jgi:hypothetical protein